MNPVAYTEAIAREQYRKCGMSLPPALATVRTPARRAKRGTGETAQRKAAIAKRAPRVLALLGTELLPEGVCVKAAAGQPNRWEQSYGDYLYMRRCAGEIADVMFQPIRLRLADGAFYTPDWVYREMGTKQVVCIEIKGVRRARGILAFKVAVQNFPQFRFKLVGKRDGAWCELRVYGRTKPTTDKQ